MKSELSPRKTAKRIVTLALVILSSLSASGQNIEVYPTTTKYWFPEYTQCVSDISNPSLYCYEFSFAPFTNGSVINLQRNLVVNGYYSSSTKTIYGIAIPMQHGKEARGGVKSNTGKKYYSHSYCQVLTFLLSLPIEQHSIRNA